MKGLDLWDNIADILTKILTKHGITQPEIKQVLDRLERRIRSKYGAKENYIHAASRDDRDRMIYALHQDNHSHRQIAKIIGVHHTTVTRVLQRRHTR